MTNSHEIPFPAQTPNHSLILPGILGEETITTGARFSLSSEKPADLVRDVVSHTQIEGFGRYLVVADEGVDETIWTKLVDEDVPRLPLLKKVDNTWIFGVKDGLKPLGHEALFGHQSSETYIGDPEIYYELGRLYRKIHEATGSLLLDGRVDEDCPLEHVALSSFSDGRGFLFVYPPYHVSAQYRGLTASQAGDLFSQSLQARLAGKVLYQESLRGMAEQLVQKAEQGFKEG